jgi:ABC-2 type transport system permease protein
MSTSNTSIRPLRKMQWLIRRELWEHKGMLLWTPVLIGILMTVLGALLAAATVAKTKARTALTINGEDVSWSSVLNAKAFVQRKADLIEVVTNNYTYTAAPLFLALGFLVFFYCLSALYDDRRDRSVLFWKSLPVSDLQTVLSKVAIALLVTPLIVLATASLTSLVLLLILAGILAAHGIHVLTDLFASPGLYLSPLQLFGLLPVYCLWALPTVGWLLMVSSWARSKVFVWAVGLPLLLLVLAVWMGKLSQMEVEFHWIQLNVIARSLLGTLPGSWYLFEPSLLPEMRAQALAQGTTMVNMSIFNNSWSSLTLPATWLGSAAGAAMIYAAIRLRGWREEN